MYLHSWCSYIGVGRFRILGGGGGGGGKVKNIGGGAKFPAGP